MKRIYWLLASTLALALAASHLTGQQPPKAGRAGHDKQTIADEAAIKQSGESLLRAYMAGDAQALAAHWTLNGEYYADDGTTIRGRAKIEKAYAALFAKKKGETRAEIADRSIRFPSRDTAIEEGRFRVQVGKEAPVWSKYSVLHVREDGKWRMAVVREWPSEGVSLHDLDWLIGSWEARHGDVEVRTTYTWWGDKSFIRVDIHLESKDRTITGFQMIGKDRSTGQIRSWTFDPDGSFAEASWMRDGKKWVQDSAGVLEDGSVLAATNILTRIDDRTFTYQSVQRTVSGEEVADIPPVRVTRVKSK